MQFTIPVNGSRGDVQPFLALGVGLQRAGHRVKLAVPQIFEGWVREYGVDFAPVRFDPQNTELHKILKDRNPVRMLREMQRVLWRQYELVFEDFWQASQGADAIICQAVPTGAFDCAEKLGVPCICVSYLPLGPTCEFGCLSASPPVFRGTYNRLTHRMVEYFLWLSNRGPVNRWRKETLGLPPIPASGFYPYLRASHIPQLFAFSPSVIPQPADWPSEYTVTGYWELENPPGWQPPAGLVAFIESGPPPVFIGFGSMKDENPQRLTQIAVDAMRLTGQRGVLLSGWAGLGGAGLPDSVFGISSVPFGWLFPQMAAIVHHGGAGTTGAALRSGKPSIIIPFMADQFGWGRIVYNMGVSPKPIAHKQLTTESLAAAIDMALRDEMMRSRAARLGERIRLETGVAQAVTLINQRLKV